MTPCKECGFEVAEEDIFCPSCGIALQSVPEPPAPADPFASTIAVSGVVADEMLAALPESQNKVESSEVADEEADADPKPTIDEIAPSIDAEDEPASSEIDEITTPDVEVEIAPAEGIDHESLSSETEESSAHEEQEAENEGLFSPAIVVEETPNTGAAEAAESAETKDPEAVEAVDEIIEEPSFDDAVSVTGTVPVEATAAIATGESNDTGGKKIGLTVLAEGTVLNSRYEILKKIGGGGMGAVYIANDRNLGGVQRAVKEMVQSHIEEAQQDKAIDDFRRESMILSSLDHPSIPTIYDYFFDQDAGRFYLVMKYISGGDLAGRLRSAPEGRVDELSVTEWGFQIADVLSYLHGLPQRIVYRDLKPSNVMLDGSTGKVMLIDFGIARSVNQVEEKGVTAVGTMGYAPPELFSGNVEPRSDIYSLGSTMFHLMTGADPQNNPLLIFDFDKNPRPRQINPRLSDQIERILMRCVEYNADQRFSSAGELRDALGKHADNLRAGRVTYGVSEAPAATAFADEMVFCGFCGQRIIAADMFCAFCGAKQPLAQHGFAQLGRGSGYTPVGGPSKAITARLVVDGTTELDAPVYLIEKAENLLGRRDPMSNIFPEVDLSKFDPQTKISRRHARIIHDGTNFLVEDLGSSNGTTILSDVSGALKLVPNRPHALVAGDRLRVGDTTLHFLIG